MDSVYEPQMIMQNQHKVMIIHVGRMKLAFERYFTTSLIGGFMHYMKIINFDLHFVF